MPVPKNADRTERGLRLKSRPRPRQRLRGYNTPLGGEAPLFAGVFNPPAKGRSIRAGRIGTGIFRPNAPIKTSSITDARTYSKPGQNDAPRSAPIKPKGTKMAAPKRKAAVPKKAPNRQKFFGQDRRRGGYVPERPQLENGQNRAPAAKKAKPTRRKRATR